MIRSIKLLGTAAALCFSGSALAQESGWSISEADGQVSVIRDGKSIYGARGTKLQIGDVVKTSGAANATLVRGEDFFVVAPDKSVRIKVAKEQGAVSQFFEYVGGLFTPDKHKTLSRNYDAAVVKGYGTSFGGEGESAAHDNSEPAETADTQETERAADTTADDPSSEQ